MDCRLPGSSIRGIFQAIVLEYYSFSRGSSRPRDQTRVSLIVDRRFTGWATREVLFTIKAWFQIHDFLIRITAKVVFVYDWKSIASQLCQVTPQMLSIQYSGHYGVILLKLMLVMRGTPSLCNLSMANVLLLFRSSVSTSPHFPPLLHPSCRLFKVGDPGYLLVFSLMTYILASWVRRRSLACA